jgi:HipA-like protein
MRKGKVYSKGIEAGVLSETSDGYVFEYIDEYLMSQNPPVSLTLPKSKKLHTSKTLFAFFFGMLAEGVLKDAQCRALRIDENDNFGRLLRTCVNDTIGCITIQDCSDDM